MIFFQNEEWSNDADLIRLIILQMLLKELISLLIIFYHTVEKFRHNITYLFNWFCILYNFNKIFIISYVPSSHIFYYLNKY